MIGEDFTRSFSATFAVLGLKLLFGQKQVTMGSVVLLGCISVAVASAWVGGTGAWIEVNVASFVNQTMRHSGFPTGDMAQGLMRNMLCTMGAIPRGESGDCTPEEDARDL